MIGEVHDNPYHHANQARAVAALMPDALVFEQITPDLAAQVGPEDIADAARLERKLQWDSRGWPDFAMYYPIFAAAPDAAIFGGGASRDDVRAAVSDGSAAVLGDAAAIFGLDRPLDSEMQQTREEMQQAAHCDALPPEMLPGMVEAQRLRDAALARAVMAALAEREARGGDGPVVVITGNGHARTDWGLPALLSEARPDVSVLSVGQFETEAPEDPTFDHWLVTDSVERDDPCEAFR